MSIRHYRTVRGIAIRRASAAVFVEPLDRRVLLSVAEPNNSFDTATVDPNNIYLEHNLQNTDSVSASSDGDDYYKFFSLYGKSHLYAALDGQTNASGDADLYVYDQNQNELARSTLGGNASETINVDIPANQYFYVRVHAFRDTEPYSLFLYNDYAGSTFATARDQGVSLGQTNSRYAAYGQIFVNDYLDYRDNIDYFKFSTESLATLNLRRLAPSNDGGPTLQTDLVLYDSNGNTLATGVNSQGGLDISNVTVPKGTYYVGLHQSVGAGEYSLRIVSDYAGATTFGARDLGNVTNTSREDTDMVGGPFDGLSAYEDALDLYKFKLDGSAGHSTSPVSINLDLLGQDTSVFEANFFVAQDTNNDGVIENSERIATFQNTGDDHVDYHGLTAGTYYIGVIPTKAYTSYTLDVDSDVDSVGDYRGLQLANNFGTFTGTKSITGGFGVAPGDITDYYKFTTTQQTTLTATAARDAANSRADFVPSLQIIKDSNNNQVYDGLSESIVASSSGSLTYTLPAGTFYLLLGSSGGQEAYTGSLKLTASAPVTDPDDTINKVKNSSKNVVATGGNVQFSLDSLQDVDLIRYVATAGQTIGFDIDGRNNTTPDTYLRLFKSDGTQVASSNNALAPGETGSTVSSYFKYTFATAGTYYLGVSLNPNTGYSPTTGNGDVNGNGPIGDYTLNALRLGSISGTVFRDGNANGVKDGGDTGFAGVTLYLDYDNDGVKDADEISVTTDSSGNYAFSGIPAGTWKVRQVLPGGYVQTSPGSNAGQGVTLSAGQSVTGKNFGVRPFGNQINNASIAGKVFYDPNGNGKQDSGESDYDGVTVYIDADNDGVLDASEKRTLTDGSGNYKFSSLAAGTYKVRAVTPSGFHQTTPTNNTGQNVTLTSGQAATGKNFGEEINPG